MIKWFVVFCLVALLNACSSNFVTDTSMLDSRVAIAKELEKQQRYSEALIQWKILQTAFPDDKKVNENVNRIERLISEQLFSLFDQLDQSSNKRSQQKMRHIYLKILALQPNNKVAIEELRKFEWENAFEKAVEKTENIKKYFAASQMKAERSIKLNKFLEQGEQFSNDRKYNALLQLADKFELAYPEHDKPREFRLFAYIELAELKLKKNDKEGAIPLFEKAILIESKRKKSLTKKNEELKNQLAKQYLTLGLKSFKSDLNKAIEMFNESLKYKPKNNKARQHLMRATRVRNNLNRIKKLNASSS